MDEKTKERNLAIMEHNTAIVMGSFIDYDDDGNEIHRVAPVGGGFLFLLASDNVQSTEQLDLETEMLKRGWMWIGVNEGQAH